MSYHKGIVDLVSCYDTDVRVHVNCVTLFSITKYTVYISGI